MVDYNVEAGVTTAKTLAELEFALGRLVVIAMTEQNRVGPLQTAVTMWTSAGQAVTTAADGLNRTSSELVSAAWRSPSDSSLFQSAVRRSNNSLIVAESLISGGGNRGTSPGIAKQLPPLIDHITATMATVNEVKTQAEEQIATARSIAKSLYAEASTSPLAAAMTTEQEIADQYTDQIRPTVARGGQALNLLGMIYNATAQTVAASSQGLKWDGPGGDNAGGPGGPNRTTAAPGGAPSGGPAGAPPGGPAGGPEGAPMDGPAGGAPGGPAEAPGDPAGASGAPAGAPGGPGALPGGTGGLPGGTGGLPGGTGGLPGGTGGLPGLPGGPELSRIPPGGLPTLPVPPGGLPTLPVPPGGLPTPPALPNGGLSLPPGGVPPMLPIGPGANGIPAGNRPGLPSGQLPPLGAKGLGSVGRGGIDPSVINGLGKGGVLSKGGAEQMIPRVGEQTVTPNQPGVGRPPTAATSSPFGTTAAGGVPGGAPGGAPGGSPMMPPMAGAGAGGGGTGRGAKPGVGSGIRPVNRKRKAQNGETPGVPVGLRGKAGRDLPGSFPMVPATSRRRKDEREKPAETLQLLDEELWKVEEAEAAEQKKRIGRLAT
jgi:hypothetical protein